VARAHDGSRHGDDVRRDRAELNKKVTREALDEALSRSKIDARRYNEEHRKIGTFDDETSMRVTDAGDEGDHDTIALDNLLTRLPDYDQEPASETTAPVDEPKKIDPDEA